MSEDGVQAEIVLEHYREPHNYGTMEKPTVSVTEANPVCGDTVNLSLLIEGGKITDVKFVGKGCSISQASASMLTDRIKDQTLDEVRKIDEKSIIEMIGLNLGPTRERCALLSYNTLQKCLEKYEKKPGNQ